MSFSVHDAETGLQYGTRSLDAVFAQRKNLWRRSFHRMLRDFRRFGRESRALLRADLRAPTPVTVGEVLRRGGYGREFERAFIVPMGAAIWSAEANAVLDMPAAFFVRFLHNHRMLEPVDQLEWRTIEGGSRNYVRALTAPFAGRIRLGTPVDRVTRRDGHVAIEPRGSKPEHFDQVILAVHSDQALALLGDPSDAEREVLGRMPYQHNEAVLHTDERLLPARRRAWAAWNYRVDPRGDRPVLVTYDMNLLQRIRSPERFLVTLNGSDSIDPDRIIARFEYSHPVFTTGAVAAQQAHARISGRRRTHYAGAYWFNGFHEDGVRSAMRVTRQIEGNHAR
jgi:predicted NAD/FAD-binding protein